MLIEIRAQRSMEPWKSPLNFSRNIEEGFLKHGIGGGGVTSISSTE